MAKKKLLCVIMPVYNEKKTILEIIRRVQKVKIAGFDKKIIIVDDFSTDGTRELLKSVVKKNKNIELILKKKNEGKGSALRVGFQRACGDYTVIQDADLEYDPEDYKHLLEPLMRGNADVVYGSRFLGQHRAFLFLNFLANIILNFVTNVLYNTILTDMETCYKMFKTAIVKEMRLNSNGFEIEPEMTAFVFKHKYKIYEVPINFYGRGYEEGKKIKASDGFKALFALIRYRF